MTERRRVVGAEQIDRASRRGRKFIEILPGSIVTDQARDAAARLGIELRLGPLDRPAAPQGDGGAALYRGLYRRHPKWMPAFPAKGRNATRFRKLTLIGAGGVGAALAQLVFNRQLTEQLTLIDLVPGLAESLAMDMKHASGTSRQSGRVDGGTDVGMAEGSSAVVVTAGRSRSPGMDRSELATANGRIVRSLAEAIQSTAPESVIIMVSNPLDEMTAVMLTATRFPRERVIGMAGTLDSARFRVALADTAAVPVSEVDAMVIGSHGAEMVPLLSLARIRGQPLHRFLSEQAIADCVAATIAAGGRIVELRRTASASIAPAHAVLDLLEHMSGRIAGAVPATIALDGEFGLSDTVIGVPCRLGTRGLIEVDEVPLSESERDQLHQAAAAVRSRTNQ